MKKIMLFFVLAIFPLIQSMAAPNIYGPTTSTDKLWQIALMARPDVTVSIEQTMIAIFRKNPQSFANDDLNTITMDSTINLPTLAEIQQIPYADAQVQIQSNYHFTDANMAKELLDLDHQYQLKFTELMQQNQVLEAKVSQMEQTVAALQSNLDKQNHFFVNTKTYISSVIAQVDVNSRLLWIRVIALVFAGIIFYIIVIKLVISEEYGDDDTMKRDEHEPEKDDYNFMLGDGVESATAKLDLARAYIDMGEKISAQKILVDVLQEGSSEQKSEAKKMLEQISQ